MFKFDLKQIVYIDESREQGTIVGRAEYANGSEPNYLLRYKAADGKATEAWWVESALVAA